MAVQDQPAPPGGDALPGQAGAGGGQGGVLDVEGQHPALGPRQPAEEGGVPAVAAGGVHQQMGPGQVGRQEILGQADGGQVGLAAADQPAPLGDKAELGPEGALPFPGGQGRGEQAGLVPAVAPAPVQHLPQQVGAVAPPPPFRQDAEGGEGGLRAGPRQDAPADAGLFFVEIEPVFCLNKDHKNLLDAAFLPRAAAKAPGAVGFHIFFTAA